MLGVLKSLLQEGHLARSEGRSVDAKRLYTQATELSRAEGNTPRLAQSLNRLGAIERDLGNIESALQHYQEAADLYRSLGAQFSVAHAVRHMGDILRESGQLAPALPYYQEALEIHRADPGMDTLDLANTLRGLALLKTSLGAKEEAIALWQEAGALYNQVWQEPGSPYSEADLTPGILESQRQIAQLSIR
jgi:tetratricopeptide (TPR) repeat protein